MSEGANQGGASRGGGGGGGLFLFFFLGFFFFFFFFFSFSSFSVFRFPFLISFLLASVPGSRDRGVRDHAAVAGAEKRSGRLPRAGRTCHVAAGRASAPNAFARIGANARRSPQRTNTERQKNRNKKRRKDDADEADGKKERKKEKPAVP